MAIDNYVDLITSEHKVQPKFTTWLTSTLSIVDDTITAANSIPTSHDIDGAVGVQLDTLGQSIGISRSLDFQPSEQQPTLDDDHYRLVLKAKIAKNQWDGTIPQIYDIWNSLFPDEDVTLMIIDNQDMTMSALVDGELDSASTELVAAGYIIPKPMTVQLKILGLSKAAESPYVGALVSEADAVTVTISTKSWSSLTQTTWNDIPDGTTWNNL